MSTSQRLDAPSAPGSKAAVTPLVGGRVLSLDVLRGVVMLLMAIDHVRVYAGVPAGGPTAGVFFTRWVTHFCAPAFVFLAGTAAFLLGRTLGDQRALSRYLLTRGIMLVLLELTIIRLSWTFSAGTMNAQLAGVIWMLGWCMVLMAALVALPVRAIAIFGLVVIFAQNALSPLLGALPSSLAWLGQFLYLGGDVGLGTTGVNISILYVIVPWIGVMAAGYAFGAIVIREPEVRRRRYLQIGGSATTLFVLVAAVAVVLTRNEEGPPAIFRVLNQRKYPASQLFLMMTLGPSILLLALVDQARGRVAQLIATFGRVPMVYYLLHIPLIHAIALVVYFLRDGAIHPEWFVNAPYAPVPEDQRWGLGLLYVVWAIVVFLLYWPCRWFAALKARGHHRWLRFV